MFTFACLAHVRITWFSGKLVLSIIPAFIFLLASAHVEAAPLNKFGTMPAPMLAAMPQIQQPLPSLIQVPPKVEEKKKRTVSIASINVIRGMKKLLSRLPTDKLKQWLSKFEAKSKLAQDKGKDKLVDYYNKLIDVCKQLLKVRDDQ